MSGIRRAGLLALCAALVGCGEPDAPSNAVAPTNNAGQETAANGTEVAPIQPASPWLPLENDNLHDPDNPALELLQQPQEALSLLPPALEGNQVDWVAAIRDGFINPRTNIRPETKVTVLDMDILFEETAGLPVVLFPHRAHTEWLDCENCHPRIFVAKRGANPINMLSILNGDSCGQCHGAVAFPLTQCKRCHSVERPSG